MGYSNDDGEERFNVVWERSTLTSGMRKSAWPSHYKWVSEVRDRPTLGVKSGPKEASTQAGPVVLLEATAQTDAQPVVEYIVVADPPCVSLEERGVQTDQAIEHTKCAKSNVKQAQHIHEV